MSDPANQRLPEGLRDQFLRGNLLRFLEDPQVPPTNNLAERLLRPAVIARKVSQCSKNSAGAKAHAGFMSVLETFKRRGQDLVEGLTTLLGGPPIPA